MSNRKKNHQIIYKGNLCIWIVDTCFLYIYFKLILYGKTCIVSFKWVKYFILFYWNGSSSYIYSMLIYCDLCELLIKWISYKFPHI